LEGDVGVFFLSEAGLELVMSVKDIGS